MTVEQAALADLTLAPWAGKTGLHPSWECLLGSGRRSLVLGDSAGLGTVYLCHSWVGKWAPLPTCLQNITGPSSTFASLHSTQRPGERGGKALGVPADPKRKSSPFTLRISKTGVLLLRLPGAQLSPSSRDSWNTIEILSNLSFHNERSKIKIRNTWLRDAWNPLPLWGRGPEARGEARPGWESDLGHFTIGLWSVLCPPHPPHPPSGPDQSQPCTEVLWPWEAATCWLMQEVTIWAGGQTGRDSNPVSLDTMLKLFKHK